MRTFFLLSILCLASFGTEAKAACKHEVTQTHTFTKGTFPLYCSYWTYCYELRVTADCTLPVHKLCIRFTAGLDNIDRGSIKSPDGWSATVNPATNEICWSAFQRSKRVQPGTSLGGFCVETNCNPKGVEGVQKWTTTLPNSIKGQSGTCLFPKPVAKLFGQAKAQPGQPVRLASLDPNPAVPLLPLFASLYSAQMPIRDLGVLYLDPATMVFLAAMNQNSQGLAQLQIPLPADPRLSGKKLHFQALDIDFTRMSLTNPWTIQIQ